MGIDGEAEEVPISSQLEPITQAHSFFNMFSQLTQAKSNSFISFYAQKLTAPLKNKISHNYPTCFPTAHKAKSQCIHFNTLQPVLFSRQRGIASGAPPASSPLRGACFAGG